MEILNLQHDVGQDSRPLFSESVLSEVSVYIWELTKGINSLKELAWAGKAKDFLNDYAYLLSTSRRYLTEYQHYVLRYKMVSIAMLYSLISLSLKQPT